MNADLAMALLELKNAIEFFDRVRASSEDERVAVGQDHWNWLENAARKAAALAPETLLETL